MSIIYFNLSFSALLILVVTATAFNKSYLSGWEYHLKALWCCRFSLTKNAINLSFMSSFLRLRAADVKRISLKFVYFFAFSSGSALNP